MIGNTGPRISERRQRGGNPHLFSVENSKSVRLVSVQAHAIWEVLRLEVDRLIINRISVVYEVCLRETRK